VATGYPMVNKFDDMYSRFDAIPACDMWTSGLTDGHVAAA